ncbi:MAG: glycosyltransferase [Candidatus Methanoplasma sp.]|jgi:glycosyltransferase involved in cell wall biosynthesis|nr:glycosyltransferase [Candidatus Methanoplasma sp.]
MTRAVVLKRESSIPKTGLDRYADAVDRCLEAGGVEREEVEFNISMERGLLPLVVGGFIRPLASILRNRSRDVTVHATDELCGIFFPLVRGRKVVTVHHVMKKGEYRGRLYYLAWSFATRVAVWSSDVVLTVSQDAMEDVKRHFNIDADKIAFMTHPPDPQYRVVEGVKKEKVIGCMGSLIARKNMSAALTAFSRLAGLPGMDGYELHICGDGPEKEALEKAAKRLGISGKVRFIASLSEEDMVLFYNRASLIFNTSLHEGLGLVTPEAHRCGTPTLHLRGSRLPEHVVRASVACDDEDDMADRAYALLTDPAEYGVVAAAALEHAESVGDRFAKALLDLYAGRGLGPGR